LTFNDGVVNLVDYAVSDKEGAVLRSFQGVFFHENSMNI